MHSTPNSISLKFVFRLVLIENLSIKLKVISPWRSPWDSTKSYLRALLTQSQCNNGKNSYHFRLTNFLKLRDYKTHNMCKYSHIKSNVVLFVKSSSESMVTFALERKSTFRVFMSEVSKISTKFTKILGRTSGTVF